MEKSLQRKLRNACVFFNEDVEIQVEKKANEEEYEKKSLEQDKKLGNNVP